MISTTVFPTPGGFYYYVPAGANYVVIKTWGGGGGGGFYSSGGGGGFSTAAFYATPGQQFIASVGGAGAGSVTGGYGGGGTGGDTATGGGGGYSLGYSGGDQIWAAGGGGGGQIYGAGGAGGGLTGSPGGGGVPGGGGTQTSGGAAGINATPGVYQVGGTGAGSTGYPGGGGGGGYYGGGGGGDGVAGVGGSGGGGGSSKVLGNADTYYFEAGSGEWPGGTGDASYPGGGVGFGAPFGLYQSGNNGYVVIHAYSHNSLPRITGPGSLSSPRSPTLALSYQISATAVPAITSYAASGLPPGLSVNPATGLISGVPATPGTYTTTISATNALGTSSVTFPWTVVAPVIIPTGSISPGAAAIGQPLTIFRAGTANFGIAYTETIIWKPVGVNQYDSLGALQPGSSVYTPTAGPGTYTVTLRIVDNHYNYSDQTLSFAVLPNLQPLNYTTSFELAEANNPGSLHLQNNWLVPFGVANIATEASPPNPPVPDGSYVVKVMPGAQLADVKKYFSSAQNWAYADVYVRPIATADQENSSLIHYGSSRIGFRIVAGQGALCAYDGNGNGSGSWRVTNTRFPIDSSGQATGWIRLTVRHDYAAKKWDLYANGTLIDYDLGMVANTAVSFTDLDWLGHATATAYFDKFTASLLNPLFTDADHDGMSDVWETANGLNPNADDRNGDFDADQRKNIEEYFAGTKANNADVTVPLAPTSYQIIANAPTSLGFAWSGATDPAGVGTPGISGYNVYRNGVRLNSTLIPAGAASYTATGLTAGSSHTFIVRTVDLAGNESASGVPLTLTATTVASSTAGTFELFTPTP